MPRFRWAELLHDQAGLCEAYAKLLGLLAIVQGVAGVLGAVAYIAGTFPSAPPEGRMWGFLPPELISGVVWIVVAVVLIAAAGPIGRLVGGQPLVRNYTVPDASE